MKNQIAIAIFILILTLISCSTMRENKVDKFFGKWEKTSNTLTDKEYKNLSNLSKSVYDIFNIVNCFSDNVTNEYPKLKYNIINNNLKVSVLENTFSKNHVITYNPFKLYIEDSIFNINPKENKGCLKYLYLTNKYKKKVFEKSNLKYGFAYSSKNTEKSKLTGRAIIDKHHLSNYFSITGGVSEIIFNRNIDSSIVKTFGIHTETESLYTFNKEIKEWKFNKIISELIE